MPLISDELADLQYEWLILGYEWFGVVWCLWCGGQISRVGKCVFEIKSINTTSKCNISHL